MPNYLEGNFSAVAIRKRGNMWQFQNKLDCPSEYVKNVKAKIKQFMKYFSNVTKLFNISLDFLGCTKGQSDNLKLW